MLLIVSFAICGVGVLQIFSATLDTPWRDAWWKQVVWIGIGTALMGIAATVDYHTILGRVPWLYGLSIAGLISTFVVGRSAYGSQRWIGIGGFRLQVSEFVKLVIILLVARYLSDLKGDRMEPRDLLKLGGLVAIPTVLVLKQPDFGTAMTYLAILVAGIFLVGLKWQHTLILVASIGLILPVGYSLLRDYQKARLLSFIDPSRDPKGSGYQVIQSEIAVGAGGIWGQGVTQGDANAVAFSAGAAHGFHLLGLRRGARVRRRGGCFGALFFDADADRSKRAGVARPGGDVYLHGHWRSIVVSHSGKRRDGGGQDAGDRYSAAADEFRRIEYFVGIYHAGIGQ